VTSYLKSEHFPGNHLRGDGWGWVLFEGAEMQRSVTKDYKQDCVPCHIPAKATDWVYVRGYPVLAE